MMLAFLGTGGYEWLIILVIALLLFGRRLPEVMRSMGKGISEFKRGLHDVEREVESAGEGEKRPAGRLPEGEPGGEERDSSSPAG